MVVIMLFNSYIFILLFMPLCLIGYFILNHFKHYKLSLTFLLIMSLWFYGYFNYSYLLIISSSIIINFTIYKLFTKFNAKGNWCKLFLIIGLIFNIGLLFYFKYFNFFVDNFNKLFNTSFNLKNIILPLGISFFTFQQISFIIDAYKKEVPHYTFIEYATFVTFFPQLIAGPIVTHEELIPQFKDKKKKHLNWENFLKGVYIFTIGLAKKILLADVLGLAVSYGFTNIVTLDTTNAIIVILSYTFQIYFDFSGYSDMAIGLGKMLNVDLPINFNSPYKALTITDFWKRWNMTVTRFFKKYVYIPLGGSRCKSKFRNYFNIFMVYFLSGIWHGANWTFIIWGAIHGIFVVITKYFKNFFQKIPKILSWIITFSFINLTGIIVRARNISDAIIFLKQIFKFNFGPIAKSILECFNVKELDYILKLVNHTTINNLSLILVFYIIISLIIVLVFKNSHEKMAKFKPTYLKICVITFILLFCITSFTKLSPFLYFNF